MPKMPSLPCKLKEFWPNLPSCLRYYSVKRGDTPWLDPTKTTHQTSILCVYVCAVQQEQDPTNLYFSGLPKDYDEKVS